MKYSVSDRHISLAEGQVSTQGEYPIAGRGHGSKRPKRKSFRRIPGVGTELVSITALRGVADTTILPHSQKWIGCE